MLRPCFLVLDREFPGSLSTRKLVIETAKLYEVQKFCSMTNHMWDGYWFLANRRSFERLPKDAQEAVAREINKAAMDERADVAKLNAELRGKLSGSGLAFNDTDPAPFRDALKKSGFYSEWRGKYGDAAWGVLQDTVGGLP